MKIEGKTILITGTARIGAELAVALAATGGRVCLLYRSSKEAAAAAAGVIRKAGGEASIVQGDVGKEDDARRVIQEAGDLHGEMHVLINMASRYKKHLLGDLNQAEWEAAMNTDARGAWLMSLAAAPVMRKSGGGRIINFADWVAASGRPRYPGYAAYYTAKKAVLGLTEALALELAPDILVNAIAPGPILAPPEMGEEEQREVEKATPLGRWGGADEIVKAVKFLIETDFVTGECIRVDGGRHLK